MNQAKLDKWISGKRKCIIAGEKVTAQLLLIWLGYSSSIFVKAFPGQTQEIFFDGIASGLEFLGGVPHQLWFDNLKVAVDKVLKGTTGKSNRLSSPSAVITCLQPSSATCKLDGRKAEWKAGWATPAQLADPPDGVRFLGGVECISG